MFVLVFIGFTIAFVATGPDVAFKPGSYEGSTTFIGVAFLINFVTAIIGGLICAVIVRGGRAPIALAIVVFILGIALAIPAVIKRRNNEHLVRQPNTPVAVAVKMGYWPVWVPFSFPFTGAIGVWIGGRLKRRQ